MSKIDKCVTGPWWRVNIERYRNYLVVLVSACVCRMSVCEIAKADQSTVISGHGGDENSANDTKHQHVVKKSSEPGVINDAMLKNLLHAHGPCGEAARLCRNIAIDYGTITELCLEYQNILKIDHIWMCFNLQKLSLKSNKVTKIENLDNLKDLRELDLSFNFVKTIENLNGLHKLEHLTLFKNDIRKIENLEQLVRLVRLNLASNFIETVEGVIKIFHFTTHVLFSMALLVFSFLLFLLSLYEILWICVLKVLLIVMPVPWCGIWFWLLFLFQIESLRCKEQLFSLNLEGNPICDKLTDNIDFRLYIAAYLPKLKYYGYRVITNAERDKGREIYKYVQ